MKKYAYFAVLAALSILTPQSVLAADVGTDPAFSAFSIWADTYLHTAPDRRPASENTGLELAENRRAVMLELIRTDPSSALEAALPASIADQLPPTVQDKLEQHVSGPAHISLFSAGAGKGQQDATEIIIKGRVFRAHLTDPLSNRPAFSGEQVKGIAIGSDLAIQNSSGTRGGVPGHSPIGREDSSLSVSFEFQAEDVTLDNDGMFDHVSLREGLIPPDPPGSPSLPAKFVNVSIPAGAHVVAVTASAQETLIRNNFLPYPIQSEVPRSVSNLPAVQQPNPTLYAQNQAYPASFVNANVENRMRGYTFVPIRLNPLRYVPSSRELFLAERITITVEYALPTAKPSSPSSSRPRFDRIAEDAVVNPDIPDATPDYNDGTSPELLDENGVPSGTCDYLIITKASLSNAFNTLALHRQAFNGFSTEIITIEWISENYDGTRPDGGNDTQTRIRNCIRDYVQTLGTEFVVLGGDNTIVPDRDTYATVGSYVNSTIPTDLYYAGLDEDWDEGDADGVYGEANVLPLYTDEGDLTPDVFVGRIPVRTEAQASDYINKVINYEQNPPYEIARKFMMGGKKLWNTYTGDDRPSDTINDGHAQFRDAENVTVSDAEMWGRRVFRDRIQAYGWAASEIGCTYDYLTSWDTTPCGNYPIAPTNLVQRFNEGWYYLTFDTHGGSDSWSAESISFRDQHALALTGNTAIVYTMACNSGGFDTAEPSLSEGFLRCANGGALVYLGSSRYGWGSPDAPPASNYSSGGTSLTYMKKFFEIILSQGIRNIGDIFFRHKSAYAASSGSNSSYRWLQFALNLQGDPALDVIDGRPTVTTECAASTLNEASGDLDIHYQRGGTATYGNEEDFVTTPLTFNTGTVVIPDGSASVTVDVVVMDDGDVEDDEVATFTIEENGSYLLSAATAVSISILEDDTDGDGMPDDWESQYELDPDTPSASTDSDGDRATDYEEYVAGTNPDDTSSCLRIEGGEFLAGQTVMFTSASGRVYRIEFKDDLLSQAWQELAEDLIGTGGIMEINDPVTATSRYYRICVGVDQTR